MVRNSISLRFNFGWSLSNERADIAKLKKQQTSSALLGRKRPRSADGKTHAAVAPTSPAAIALGTAIGPGASTLGTLPPQLHLSASEIHLLLHPTEEKGTTNSETL